MTKRTLKASKKTGIIKRADIRSAIEAVHIMPKAGQGWIVRTIGGERISQKFERKKDAINFAHQCRKQKTRRLIVHGPDGRIQSDL